MTMFAIFSMIYGGNVRLDNSYELSAGRHKMKCQSKKEGKDQELIQSSTTPDPEHRMGK